MVDERILAMAEFVRPKSRVADIGADHGYLSIELARRGKVSKIVATDKNPGPIAAAKKNISKFGLEKIIELRQGDGLKILRAGEVDTICIGGMGGTLIREILKNSPEVISSAEYLILQPMTSVDSLKNFLTELGWFLADENLAESGGIIYEIIFFAKTIDSISRPTKKENSPLLKKFLEQKIEKLRRISDEMKKSSVPSTEEKFFRTQAKLSDLEKIFNQIF